MDWEGKAEESSNLEDRRGMGKTGVAIGGGLAVLIAIIGTLLGVDPQMLQKFVGNAPVGQGKQVQGTRPLTPEEQHSKKFAATILKFTEEVWDDQFRKHGKKYEPPHMVLFSDEVNTGCGAAPASVGPFYCPADRTVYLDPTFFTELQERLGGSKAEFSQAYVIAHEVGHHVQNLLGYSALVHQKRDLPKAEYNQWSVRLELQADYLAGVWAHYGQEKFKFIQPGDIESALTSANAIGDDRLQKRSRGFVSPEKYTHGTSEQRVKWFRRGLETGDMGTLKKMFEMPYNEL